MSFPTLPVSICCILALHTICVLSELAVDPTFNHLPIKKDDSGSEKEQWKTTREGLYKFTVDDLRRELQTAIAIRELIIPPLMTARATIYKDDDPGINKEVSIRLMAIEMSETANMASTTNILNAVNGKPDLTCQAVMPKYPSRVPGGVRPSLIMPIRKISRHLVRSKFMEFELPDRMIERIQVRPVLSAKTGHFPQQAVECESDLKMEYCYEKVEDIRSGSHYVVVHHSNTVTGYFKRLACQMVILECEARAHNGTIFTGDPSRQLSGPGGVTPITNLREAVTAIENMIKQGQGLNICNPLYQERNETMLLSRYYSLKSIYEGADVAFHNDSSAKICQGVMFFFNGSVIPFDPNNVLNMVPNPQMWMYPLGSEVRERAEKVNSEYTLLLETLNTAFNGHPEKMPDAFKQLFALRRSLKTLVQTPIPGTKLTGGPTFDCVTHPGSTIAE